MSPSSNFYPRPPRGGRLDTVVVNDAAVKFLSTPSARRATKLAESIQQAFGISIHALREEGDDLQDIRNKGEKIFLSTPSARRATATLLRIAKAQNISIHALREEGDYTYWPEDDQTGKISIHALREEGDAAYRDDGHGHRNFYPRPPRGGRRPLKCGLLAIIDFYPRPPRGGRRARYFSACGSWVFLSTPSARRATLVKGSKYFLRAFLSTPSARRATTFSERSICIKAISIHALREEGDTCTGLPAFRPIRFLSTPSARRATTKLHA